MTSSGMQRGEWSLKGLDLENTKQFEAQLNCFCHCAIDLCVTEHCLTYIKSTCMALKEENVT